MSRAANVSAVAEASQDYRPDLAEMFDQPGMTFFKARQQARRMARKKAGFGIAEVLLLLQVISALWAAWERYKKSNPSFLATKSTEADPASFATFVTSIADEQQQ